MERERETRLRRIDRRLAAAGWPVRPWREGLDLAEAGVCALTEYPTASGPADYALVEGGLVRAIVEAKRVGLGPYSVLEQAQRYSRGVAESPTAYREFHVPFLYSTNGEQIWFEDVRLPEYRQREVAGFHTPAALAETLDRDLTGASAWFAANPNRHPKLRPYQIEANEAVEAAIARGDRTMLVAMATGTGKTYTTISQIYRLIKSGAARRVLFLVDRRALAAQAVRAFSTFEAEPNLKFDKLYEVYSQRFQQGDLDDGDVFDAGVMPAAYLTNPGPSQTFIYVCTIQRMGIYLYGREGAFPLFGDAEGDDEEAGRLEMPISAFDVVIADECHRGYTAQELGKWRGVLDHFDAIRIGLTATPAAHTTAYFKDIVYRYEYEHAVREGYLVDYDVVKVSSNVRLRGVFLKRGEQIGEIDPETGSEQLDRLEEERG